MKVVSMLIPHLSFGGHDATALREAEGKST